jgi:hypothetical protein
MPEIKAYGVSASGAWTSPANAVGASDGLVAQQSTTATLGVVMTGALAALPDDALIDAVYIGATCRTSTTGARVTIKLTAGDVTATALNPGTAALVDREVQLAAGLFTPAILKGTLSMYVNRTTATGIAYVDAVWVRVVYTVTPGSVATIGYATSVAQVSPEGAFSNLNNALGPPDGAVTDHNTTNTAVMKSLTGTFAGLSTIPDTATIQQVRWGAAIECNSANGRIYLSSLRGDDTAVDAPASFAGPFTLQSREYVSAGSWTVAQVKAIKVQWAFNNPSGSGFPSQWCDAMWVQVTYTMAAVSRAKRWSGSAWVDAPVKRWDGSAYVPATVKRWNGSAWV